MTTLRSRLFILISLVVLIILAISIAIIVFVKQKKAATAEQPTTEQPTNIDTDNFPAQITPPATVIPSGVTVKPLTTEEARRNAAKQMAKIFTERYGTYSSDSDFANIREVKTLVTADLWAVLEKKIGASKPATFIGVTTNAVASEVASYENTKAMVEVSAQRTTTKGSETTQTNEKANVWLVQSNGNWLVDDFKWIQ